MASITLSENFKALWRTEKSGHLLLACEALEGLYQQVELRAEAGRSEIAGGRNVQALEREWDEATERRKEELLPDHFEVFWKEIVVRTQLKVRDSLRLLFHSCNTRNLYGVVLAARCALQHAAVLQYLFDEIPWKKSIVPLSLVIEYTKKLRSVLVGSRFRWDEFARGNIRELLTKPELKRPARESLPALTTLVEGLGKALDARYATGSEQVVVRLGAGEVAVLYVMLSDIVHPGWGGEFIYGPDMTGRFRYELGDVNEFRRLMMLFWLPVVPVVSHFLWLCDEIVRLKPNVLRR